MKKITLLILIALTTITTHGQNKLLSSIDEFYYDNTWNKNSGYNYEYDSNNNLITETYLDWNSTINAWDNLEKTTYTYNNNNKVTQGLFQGWDSVTLTFVNSYRDLYTYTNGRLMTIESQEWINSNWVSYYKGGITYNANNLPSTILWQDWNGSQWVNEELTTYTYNLNNIVISSVFEEWVGGQWVNSEKTVYTYDSKNKLITDRGAIWDDFNSIWAQNGDKIEYEWDVTGNKTQNIDFYGYNGNNYQYKEEYAYDITKLMNNFAHPFKDKTGFDYFEEGGFPFVNKVLTENDFSYNTFSQSYQISSRTTYNYNSAITLSTDTFKKEVATITVYPNPTSDYLNIQNESNTEIDTVTITDLTGKKVLDQNNNARQINVRNLAKGIYILGVFSGGKQETRKFIKE